MGRTYETSRRKSKQSEQIDHFYSGAVNMSETFAELLVKFSSAGGAKLDDELKVRNQCRKSRKSHGRLYEIGCFTCCFNRRSCNRKEITRPDILVLRSVHY